MRDQALSLSQAAALDSCLEPVTSDIEWTTLGGQAEDISAMARMETTRSEAKQIVEGLRKRRLLKESRRTNEFMVTPTGLAALMSSIGLSGTAVTHPYEIAPGLIVGLASWLDDRWTTDHLKSLFDSSKVPFKAVRKRNGKLPIERIFKRWNKQQRAWKIIALVQESCSIDWWVGREAERQEAIFEANRCLIHAGLLLSWSSGQIADAAAEGVHHERLAVESCQQIRYDSANSSRPRGPAQSSESQFGLPTIGIVTALPKECAAVRATLEGEARCNVAGTSRGQSYYVGRVPSDDGGSHVVAVALLPDMGNNAAAISVTCMRHHFPRLEHIIMCGVAGGVPKPGVPEHDLRLGDIVVSDRNGVVQYDLIKERPDGSREHRFPPRPPSAELLGAVRHLWTEEEMGRRPWERFLPIVAKLTESERPADNVDARGVVNPHLPPDPMRRPGLPRVFHGAIAAANTLLKNPEHRDYLAAKFGVKAIEMEGSGVADATWLDGAGYLVVRAICDFCDDKKGDIWQKAAAAAAAAYVRALIGSLPTT